MRTVDYEAMYGWTYSKKGLSESLMLIERAAVILAVISYVALLVFSSLGTSLYLGIKYLVLSAVPFICVSVFRHLFNAPRPSELYDLLSLGADASVCNKRGRSFPSRHVFSSFLVGTLLLMPVPILGGVVLVFGIALGACRVLRGVHFIRDCVSGAIIGALCGIIGMVVLLVW